MNHHRNFTIAIDFDDTIVEGAFPGLGAGGNKQAAAVMAVISSDGAAENDSVVDVSLDKTGFESKQPFCW